MQQQQKYMIYIEFNNLDKAQNALFCSHSYEHECCWTGVHAADQPEQVGAISIFFPYLYAH
jgi:hypothetical protein